MKTLGIIESFFEWVANKMNCVSLSRINRIGWVSKLVWRELSWSSHEVGQFTSFFFFFSFSFVSFFFQTQFHTPPLLLSFLFAVPIEGTLSLSLSLSLLVLLFPSPFSFLPVGGHYTPCQWNLVGISQSAARRSRSHTFVWRALFLSIIKWDCCPHSGASFNNLDWNCFNYCKHISHLKKKSPKQQIKSSPEIMAVSWFLYRWVLRRILNRIITKTGVKVGYISGWRKLN